MTFAGNADWGLLFAGADGLNGKGEKGISFFPQLLLLRDGRRERQASSRPSDTTRP